MVENGLWVPERVAVFDIGGPLALFRKPYSPLSPVSFPLPPPTAVFGMVGAILGLSKDEYLQRLSTDDAAVGVRILKRIQKLRATLNLLNTKDRARYLWRPEPAGGRIQIPHEYLKDVAYRIYFGHSDSALVEQLAELLARGESVFTPCLGRTECIAEVEGQGIWPVESWQPEPDEWIEVHTAAPTDTIQVQHERGVAYGRFRVPARMAPDRTVTRYTEVVVRDDAKPIRCTARRVYRCSRADDPETGDVVVFI